MDTTARWKKIQIRERKKKSEPQQEPTLAAQIENEKKVCKELKDSPKLT